MSRTTSRKIFVASILAAAAASTLPAHAATILWTGQGGNSNWSTTANWSTNVPPANNVATDDVQLSGNVTASAIDSAWAVKSLTFNANALGFTVTGSPLTTGAGITNSSPYATQTINTNVTLGAAQTFTNSSAAPANVNVISTQIMKPADTLLLGGTTLDNGGFLLTMAGNGATRIDSQITGAGGLTINAGTTTLTNASNNFTGTLTINGATLIVNNIGALGGTGAIVIGGAANVVYNNNANASISRAFTLNNNIVLANIGTGTLTLTGGMATGGPARNVTLRGAGNITIDTVGINASTGTLDKVESGTATINAASTFNAITVRGGTLAITAPITQTSGNVNIGWFGNNNTAPNTSSPTITMANTGATLRLSGTGTLNTTGAYNIAGGSTLTLDNGTTDNTNRIGAGTFTMRGGTLNFIGRNDNSVNSSEAIGAVVLAGNYGATNALVDNSVFGGNGNVINVDRNGAASATLTLGATPIRSSGAYTGNNLGTSIDYRGTEDLGTTSKVLFTGGANTAFIGSWATVTNTSDNSTDFAQYDTTNGVTKLVGARPSDLTTSISTDNVVTTANSTLGGASAANSVKLGGNLDVAGNALTIASGGLIANTGTGNTISDSAPSGTSGIKTSGSEFFLYTPGASSTTLTAKVLEGTAGSVFTKTGAGTLIYNAPGSTYTGATIVNGGTLKAGADNALPTGTYLIANDTGTFDLNGFDVQVADILGHGTINLSAGKTLTVTNNIGNNTTAKTAGFTGNLTGTGSLTLNGTGSVGFTGNNPDFAGTINLNKGQLQFEGNSGADIFGKATINLGLDSNPVTMEGRPNNTPTAWSSLATINIKGADVQIGPSLVNLGRVYTFNGPINFDKGANATQTFRPGTTGGMNLNGQVSLANDVTLAVGVGSGLTSGQLNINKGITQTSNVKLTNSAGITLNIAGDGYTSGNGLSLTLAGAGTNNVNTVQGVNSQKFVVGDGATTPAVTFASINSTFDGGVELVSGTLTARGLVGTGISGATPVVFAGPVGRGLLKVTGGAGQLNLGNTTLYNNVEVNGGAGNAFTFDDNGSTEGTRLRGVTTFKSASPMTVNFNDGNSDNVVSNAILHQDVTFASPATLRVGIGNNGTNRNVSFSGAGGKNVEGFTSGAGTTTFISGNFNLGGTGGLFGSGGAYIINGPSVTAGHATHTFSNGVTLQTGTLTATNSGSVFGNGTLEIQGGTIRATGGLRTVSTAPVNVTNSFTIADSGNGGDALNFSSAATITNSPSITNNSTSGAFAFDGGTTLTSGFTLTGAGQFRMSGLTLPGDRTLTLNSTGTTTFQGALSGAYNLDLTGANQNVILGNLSGSGTKIRINDAAIKTTFNSAAGTYSGGTDLIAGTLVIANNGTGLAGPLGTGALTLYGGTVTTDGNPRTVGSPVVADTGTVTFIDNSNNALSLTGAVTFQNSPTLNQIGANNLTLGNITLTSGATIAGTGSNFNLTNGLTLPGNRTLTFTGNGAKTLGGTLSGAFNLDLVGTSQNVILGNLTGSDTVIRINDAAIKVNANNGAATFSGGVTLLSGTLQIAANSTGSVTSGPLGTGTLTLAGGSVTTDNSPRTVANAVATTGGSTTFVGNNDQPLTLSGGLTVTGSTSFNLNNGNSKVTFSGASSLAGDLTLAGAGSHEFAGQFTVTGSRTITSSSNNALFTGGFTGAGNIAFAGGRSDIRGGTSNNSGLTSILAGATLFVGHPSNATGADVLSPNSVYDLASTATLNLFGWGNLGSGGRLQTVGGLTGTGTVLNSNSGGGYGDNVSRLVINATGNNTFNGLIAQSNGIRVIIQGSGIQNFASPNTYQDGTAVNAGTLLVNNLTGSGTGSGAVAVASGATLGGSGIITGATTISGSLSPGNSIGTLTVTNDVTWNGGDNWVFELGAASASLALADSDPSINDRLNITGASSDFLKGTGSTWTFDFDGDGAAGFYKLVDWTTGTTTFSTSDFTAFNLAPGFTPTFIIDGPTSALYLQLTSDTPEIPEPASLSLLALGGLGLLGRRRRA